MKPLVSILLVAGCGLWVFIGWRINPEKTRLALKEALRQFILILPFLIAAFILVGIIKVFPPKEYLHFDLKSVRGTILGLIIAAFAGSILSGPPVAVYPLAKTILANGAGVAGVATFILAWTAVGTVTLPLEIKLFGTKFALTRWLVMLVISVVIGLLMGLIL
jgi:uncharacterized membrane protein YraQ (UPF0718 family)